jgi:Flp pilus assembly protein TadD
LLALGDAFLEGDQLRNAVKPLQQAAQLDAKSARAQLLLGTVFQGLGREKEAIVAYKRYLELEPHGEFAGDVRAIVANLSR